jgi:hypothetical protein
MRDTRSSTNLENQLETWQEPALGNSGQNPTQPNFHLRQNPQGPSINQTGVEYRLDRSGLGSSGWTQPAGQLQESNPSISQFAPRIQEKLWGMLEHLTGEL